MYDIVTLITLQQTFPMVVMGFVVFAKWAPSGWEAVRGNRDLTHYECLIVGVCFSMLNKFTDPSYWAIPWSLNFLGHDSAKWWFDFGAYPNLIFRQFCGVGATYFHLLSTYKVSKINEMGLKITIISSNALGVVFIVFLYATKNGS